MKHYKVVHVQRQNYPVAYLSYDTKTQQFSLRIRKGVSAGYRKESFQWIATESVSHYERMV